jgi:hypothetical protein
MRVDVRGVKAPAKISLCGGVRDALGAQGVEEDTVVAPHLDILDHPAAAQAIVGDIEHVVGFVVGLVLLENLDLVVDAFGQPQLLDQ